MSTDLFVPDRFDILEREAPTDLQTIIEPVEPALEKFDSIVRDMRMARRGAFQVFRGESGSGKSTFLHTLHLFRTAVQTVPVRRGDSISAALSGMGPARSEARVVVIEGREALRDTSTTELEAAVHDINGFLRSAEGAHTLIVWPCNTDDLLELLLSLANSVGGDALLGVSDPVYAFTGPEQREFIRIAEKTIGTLNNQASLADYGVSRERAEELLAGKPTIGKYLGRVRQEIQLNTNKVATLLKKEQCRLWVVVSASNEPDNDVAALTRGTVASIDIERLMTATDANVVKELKRYPDKLGILGTVLDAKILHLPVMTALAVARAYGDAPLHAEMRARGLSTSKGQDALDRLKDSELFRAYAGKVSGVRSRSSLGSNTKDAFKRLVDIAIKKDALLNRSVAEALVAAGSISGYALEKDLGDGLTKFSDIVSSGSLGSVRVEMMWRAKTGRAEIANYTLGKLYSYGRAIGFLN